MKVLLQRVAKAGVSVAGCQIGAIERGLLAFLCAMRGDSEVQARRLAERAATWRCFPDAAGRMNLDVAQAGGSILVVSQFTLAADGRQGRRPSFSAAAEPPLAEALYKVFLAHLAESGLQTACGRFGADMQVELINDGPVTFLLEEPLGPPAGRA